VFGTALLMMGLADAIYSVSATGHSHDQGIYDVAWVAGAALVAFAAWEPHPGQLEPRRATGWRAIALPLAAQLMAVSIQIYAFFHEIARSERILTALVLVIAMVQVVATRPRAQSGGTNHRDHH
jgi:fatty-acid desaturase